MPEALMQQQLIASVQVLGLHNDSSLPDADCQILRQANKERRPLSTGEMQQICSSSKVAVDLPEYLQNNADRLVNQARRFLLMKQSHLVQPGGTLFQPKRAEACWRDCREFFRVIVYAVACRRPKFTNPEGMAALRELYALIGVPVDAIHFALNELLNLTQLEIQSLEEQILIRACFTHLTSNLQTNLV
ncbi:phycobilisome polypeptide [Synechococcus sp. M16CYN]|uniref:phycobilisome polypeptide n=1 Tax=Synechococcus sp. M16CYN TaxID=3103139 RepID=UPI0030E4B8AB